MASKSRAYESEEARLQAQRRMLAERYGLGVSDEEDEAESSDDASGESASELPEYAPRDDLVIPPVGNSINFERALREKRAARTPTRTVSPMKSTAAAPVIAQVQRKLDTEDSGKPELPASAPAPTTACVDKLKQAAVTILQPKRIAAKTSAEVKNTAGLKINAGGLVGVSKVKKEAVGVEQVGLAGGIGIGTGKQEKEKERAEEEEEKEGGDGEKEDAREISEEAADAIIEATKKIIERFEEQGRARDMGDTERIEKLTSTLKEKLEGNIVRNTNATMKKCYAKVIIPNVSDILTKITPDEKLVNASRQEYFTKAFSKSDLVTMYKAGCDEIREQIGSTVERSMNEKQITLLERAMQNISEAGEDIAKTVDGFVNELAAVGFSGNGVGRVEGEDIRCMVKGDIEGGEIDKAFLAVLDKGDLELVSWLLKQFDPKTFFENNTISQVAILSLAQQIGQKIGVEDEDCADSVEWLRELMLMLVPNDESIAEAVGDTLVELRTKISSLQHDKTIRAKHPLLPKQLKQLGYVIMSVASQ